jgi:hypothetical protein
LHLLFRKKKESKSENEKAIKAEIIVRLTVGESMNEWKKVNDEWKDFFSALVRLLVRARFYVSSRSPFTFSCDVVDFFLPNASHFFSVLFVKFKKQTWDFTKKKWADGVDDSAAFTSKCAESAFDFFFARRASFGVFQYENKAIDYPIFYGKRGEKDNWIIN